MAAPNYQADLRSGLHGVQVSWVVADSNATLNASYSKYATFDGRRAQRLPSTMQPWTRRRPTGSAPRAWPGWCSRWSAGWAPSATTPTGCSGGRELMTGWTRNQFVCQLGFVQVRHEGPQPRNGPHSAGRGPVRWDGFWNARRPSRTREVSLTMDADYQKGPSRSNLTLKGLKLKGLAQPRETQNPS